MAIKVEILKQKQNYFLWIDDYLWMWDIPYEVELQRELAEKAAGDVLVAGYGLGIIHRYLQQNKSVKSVTTVELIPEVIDACQNTFGEVLGEIVIGDYYTLELDEKFDFVIGDIWPDISPACLPDYEKFKNRSMHFLKPQGTLLAWGQDYFEYLLSKK